MGERILELLPNGDLQRGAHATVSTPTHAYSVSGQQPGRGTSRLVQWRSGGITSANRISRVAPRPRFICRSTEKLTAPPASRAPRSGPAAADRPTIQRWPPAAVVSSSPARPPHQSNHTNPALSAAASFDRALRSGRPAAAGDGKLISGRTGGGSGRWRRACRHRPNRPATRAVPATPTTGHGQSTYYDRIGPDKSLHHFRPL